MRTVSANVISTDDQGFERAVLQSPQPVLVDFWAPWCGPCRMISPIVEELAGEYSDRLRTVKVNLDDSEEVGGRFGIMSIPALVFFKDGQEVKRMIGARPKAQIAAAIDEVLGGVEVRAS